MAIFALNLELNVRRRICAEGWWLPAALGPRKSGRGRIRAPPHNHPAWRKRRAELRLPKARIQMSSSGVADSRSCIAMPCQNPFYFTANPNIRYMSSPIEAAVIWTASGPAFSGIAPGAISTLANSSISRSSGKARLPAILLLHSIACSRFSRSVANTKKLRRSREHCSESATLLKDCFLFSLSHKASVSFFKGSNLQATLPLKVLISNDVLSADMDASGAVLLSIDSGTYYSLSPVAAYLWKLWTKDGSVKPSIERLMQDYRVDQERAESDVAELLGELERSGLISIDDRE